MRLLGGLTAEVFLRDYWQKKPLLIKKALTGANKLISPDELAGLACEEHCEARLVKEHAGEYPWQVQHGPFSPEVFSELPKTHWTLLVQKVDRRLSKVSRLVEKFSFIPNWRLDDVMISYAPDQGSVGPHFDHYDVFLIQIQGKRLWRIGLEPVADDAFIPELDLKILKTFAPAAEWLVEEGDMLYLPPRMAHHGIAQGEALTASIGFRAPSYSEVLNSFASYAAAAWEEKGFYEDPDLTLQENPGEIKKATRVRFQAMFSAAVNDEVLFTKWLGRFLTSAYDAFAPEAEEGLTSTELQRALVQGGTLCRMEGGRIAYSQGQKAYLFCEGECFPLTENELPIAKLLAASHCVPGPILQKAAVTHQAWELIARLMERGYFYLKG